jgi:anti-sigma factor RsiW
MPDNDILLQRAVDGQLGPAENAAVRCMIAGDPQIAAREQALTGLDQLLRQAAAPRRQLADHQRLRERIMARLPANRPIEQVQLRIGDVVLGTAVIGLLVMTYGTLGLVLDRSLLLVLLAGISLVAGCGLLAFAGALRGDLPMLGMLLRRRIAVGPGEVLVYRAIGLTIAVGGIWLTAH